jgi:hypothetical protein
LINSSNLDILNQGNEPTFFSDDTSQSSTWTPNILTREEQIIGPGTPVVKGFIWFLDGSRTVVGTGAVGNL